MTSTRDRLLDAGLQLFAERGFRATTVGDIEAEAGFVARGGTLYKHFGSKAALLDAALARHVDSVTRFDELLALLPLPDLASELHLIGRWLLAELDREELITRVIEKEGANVGAVIDAMREGISEPGYRYARAYIETRFPEIDADRDALAVLVLGALINLRRSRWTFGKPPLGVDDDQALTAWVSLVLAVGRDGGLS